jgi:hypothetical protein
MDTPSTFTLVVAALWAVSELAAQSKRVKANSVFQLVVGFLKKLRK